MSGVVGSDLVAMPYDERLTALTTARVALWDVIADAERTGSLDSAIRDPEFADLAALAASLPDLRAVAFNGGTAARTGRRLLSGVSTATLVDLPSSSPAHAALPFEAKAAAWERLKAWLA